MATSYVDQITGSGETVAYKAPCRVATTANIALSGLQTVDGVVLAADDRVLVKNQTNAVDNGIWIVSTGVWSRSRDFDSNRDVSEGTQIYVTDGTLNARTGWAIATNNPINVGVDNIVIEQSALVNAAQLEALEAAATAAAAAAQTAENNAEAAQAAAEAAAASLNLPVMAPEDAGQQLFARGDASGYDLLPGMLNVMSFIPSAHWAGIRDRTITADLSAYIQEALDVAGDRGEVVFFPSGRYPHATGLIYGPQTTSYTPSGDDTTSDLHFMQVPQSKIVGVGFAELYATAAMTAQLTITFQNGKQSPHGTRVEGLFFNGRNLASRGIKSQWTFNTAFINNRFDAHTVVNFEHEGRAHLRMEQNIFRGQKNVLMRLGGDNYLSGNDFYVKGTAGAVRRCIEFGPSSGNTVVGKDNVFTLEAGFNPDNTNATAIYIDGISTYLATTGNRDIQIDGCEFHGFEYGVLAEGASGTNLKNIDIINCHAMTGAQTKTTLVKIHTARAVNIINNRSNTIDTTRSTTPSVILHAVENAEISHNHLRGVTGVEAVQIVGNCIDVSVHDNHFLEAVNTAHPYIKVDASSLVTITDNYAQQYTAFTTKFVQETGAGTGNVYGDNHLSASFTDPYDVASSSTTYRGKDYSSATQATVAAGATVYLGENGTQAAEYLTAWLNPSRPKYAKRLVVQSNAAPGASQTFTYTLSVDGVDTALTAQIAGAATFTAVDIDREAAIALGSRFAVKLVTSAGAAVTAHRVALTLT